MHSIIRLIVIMLVLVTAYFFTTDAVFSESTVNILLSIVLFGSAALLQRGTIKLS
ncbi:hypothetical protein NURINAE_01276 [Candidatus Nitrosacidococcus sp. I8]|nr:hypothetical protein NURINAE_01276 [Candidatus Nitrosacidococcus sp. I8]